MTDHELIDAAAKAADMPSYGWWWVDGVLCKAGDKRTPWNPLLNDGDNRRLQVKLNLGLVPQEEGDWVCITYDSEGDEVVLAVDANPNRAIVRAAAASTSQEKERT